MGIGHLLMNILLFSITMVIPVAGICCLEYPHIQAHGLEPFMVGYAIDLTSILFFLHDHPLDFIAADALTAGGHNYTISTLTPIIYSNIKLTLAVSQSVLPVCIGQPFLVS